MDGDGRMGAKRPEYQLEKSVEGKKSGLLRNYLRKTHVNFGTYSQVKSLGNGSGERFLKRNAFDLAARLLCETAFH